MTDLLAFAPYELAFTEMLLRTELDAPFVAGIFGRWGSGKSTFIRKVRDRLIGRGQAAVLFQPWLFDEREEVWKALIFSVLQYLQDHSRDKREAFRALDDLLIGLASSGVNKAMTAVGLTGRREAQNASTDLSTAIRFANTFRDEFERAVGKALGEQRRLYVFVDDLDRCTPAACVSTIEAIKLFFDVPGCVFVLGIDKELVQAGIASKYQDSLGIDGAEYLEKLIQLPFALPAVSELQFDAFAKATASRYSLPDEVVWLLARFSSRNPRRFKRLLNCHLLVWASVEAMQVGDEVESRKLAWLLGLRQHAPEIQQLAVSAPREYLALHHSWFHGNAIAGEAASARLCRAIAIAHDKAFTKSSLRSLFADEKDLGNHLWLTDLTGTRSSEAESTIEPPAHYTATKQWAPPKSQLNEQRVQEFRRQVSAAVQERIGLSTILGWTEKRQVLDELAKLATSESEAVEYAYEYRRFFRSVKVATSTMALLLVAALLGITGPDAFEYLWQPLDKASKDRVSDEIEDWLQEKVAERQRQHVEAGAAKAVQAWQDELSKATDVARRSFEEERNRRMEDQPPLLSLPLACEELAATMKVEQGTPEDPRAEVPGATLARLIERVAKDASEEERSRLEREYRELLAPIIPNQRVFVGLQAGTEKKPCRSPSEASKRLEEDFVALATTHGNALLRQMRFEKVVEGCAVDDHAHDGSATTGPCKEALARVRDQIIRGDFAEKWASGQIPSVDQLEEKAGSLASQFESELAGDVDAHTLQEQREELTRRRDELLQDSLRRHALVMLGFCVALFILISRAWRATRPPKLPV